jgi:hypothetical protein
VDLQLWETRRNQRLSAQATGADNRPRRQGLQAVEVVGDEGIAWVFALEHGGEGEAFGQLHWHIFQGVHREIGPPLFHCDFELFDEQALTAHFGQGTVEDLVATRRHAKDFDSTVRI